MMINGDVASTSADPIDVIISFRNRPTYLWSCLDALYRLTRHSARFMLIDMASDDPAVARVVEGFRRRGMFASMVRMHQNDPRLLIQHIYDAMPNLSDCFAYVEGDAVVVEQGPCWLTEMAELMALDPLLAMLGATIDKSDFIAPDFARQVIPDLPEERVFALAKLGSPERLQALPDDPEQRIFSPHNPAGRFLMLRKQPVREVGIAEDWLLHSRLLAAGYRTGIATHVMHRHLSLLNLYDYADYDMGMRDAYMLGANGDQS